MTLKIKNMNTKKLINQFCTERNHSQNSKYSYVQSLKIFESFTNQKLYNLLYLAKREQEKDINWNNQTIRQYLIDFRAYLYNKYKKNTAHMHLTRVKAFLQHYDIEIGKLPYFSTKKAEPSIPINPDLMLDREILQLCINVKNPLLKSIVLFMSSTGMTKIDTLHLTVQDFLDATMEYHNTNHISNALYLLKDNHQAVGTWHNFKREKTGQIYFTFNSPESTIAIAQYLLTRERLAADAPLFDISYKYMSDLFKDTNDLLGLGKNGQYNRFASHMLRRYHATQLTEAGMELDKINILEGRKPKNIAYQSYIKLKPSRLKDEYIECLPYLVVEDYTKVKTELDATKEQLEIEKHKNNELENNINNIWAEISLLKNKREKRLRG